ncbi:MAG TPA: hypothetical protein VIG03_03185 [Steroidobacteraceae bacterium]|jgi:hypothetical protein
MLERLFRIKIAVQVHPGYVELTCTGIYSRNEALRVGNEGYRQAALENRIGVLIDVRKITGRLPTLLDRYDFGVHIAEQYLSSDPRVRLALLGHEPMIHPDRFGELVARNRGADARVFTDEALAVDWLRSRPA